MENNTVPPPTPSPHQIKTILAIGSGYVGALTMTIFAYKNPSISIYVYDVYKPLITKWNNVDISNPSSLPIVESNLYEYFKTVYNKNLFFISEIPDNILLTCDLIFICVNTPSITNYNYGTDITLNNLNSILMKGIELSMENVYKCVKDLTLRIIPLKQQNPSLFHNKIIIQKSTVAVSTLERLHDIIVSTFTSNTTYTIDEIDACLSLVNIPEFLAEGTAITNLLYPDRVVIGHIKGNIHSQRASTTMCAFYSNIISQDKIVQLDSTSSEMTKLIANAFLAQRISSINSLTELCELTNANVHTISNAVGSDKRIGKRYLKASMGFGGSCFKKDILSLIFLLNSMNMTVQGNYWAQVLLMNEYQRIRVCKKIVSSTKKKKVAVLGMAFKGDVGDVRCSNAVFLISYLFNNDIVVKMFDPFSTADEVRNELKVYDDGCNSKYNYNDIYVYRDVYECVKECDVIVFVNNHTVFKEIDMGKVVESMSGDKIVFDLYDNFEVDKLKEQQELKVFKLGEYDGLK